jgi:hypothetical protein
MDDPLLVRRFERLGDLRRDRQRFGERDRPFRNAVGQRRPLDELHHQREGSVRLLQAVDMRDVRMVQGGEDFGFALESGQSLGISPHRLRQHLMATWRFRLVSVARYTSPCRPHRAARESRRAEVCAGNQCRRRQTARCYGERSRTVGLLMSSPRRIDRKRRQD